MQEAQAHQHLVCKLPAISSQHDVVGPNRTSKMGRGGRGLSSGDTNSVIPMLLAQKHHVEQLSKGSKDSLVVLLHDS